MSDSASDEEDYKFKSNVKFRSESDDDRLNADMVVQAMKFSQHEFVKMNEVGQLVQDAIQGVMDKIKQKDTMIQQNKQSLRALDNKFKQLQQEVVGLNKLNKN